MFLEPWDLPQRVLRRSSLDLITMVVVIDGREELTRSDNDNGGGGGDRRWRIICCAWRIRVDWIWWRCGGGSGNGRRRRAVFGGYTSLGSDLKSESKEKKVEGINNILFYCLFYFVGSHKLIRGFGLFDYCSIIILPLKNYFFR